MTPALVTLHHPNAQYRSDLQTSQLDGFPSTKKPLQETEPLAGDPCHRIAFKASVVGLRTTVHLVAVQLGPSPFVVLLSYANQCFPRVIDGQQQGTEPVSCCGLCTRCMRREYALIACTVILILSTFFLSIQR